MKKNKITGKIGRYLPSVISILGNPNFGGGVAVALIIMAVKSNRFAMHAFCSCAFVCSVSCSLARSIDRFLASTKMR
jgi:hypothetical protein